MSSALPSLDQSRLDDSIISRWLENRTYTSITATRSLCNIRIKEHLQFDVREIRCNLDSPVYGHSGHLLKLLQNIKIVCAHEAIHTCAEYDAGHFIVKIQSGPGSCRLKNEEYICLASGCRFVCWDSAAVCICSLLSLISNFKQLSTSRRAMSKLFHLEYHN